MGEDFTLQKGDQARGGQRFSLEAPALSLSDWRYELSLSAPYQAENSAVAATLLAVLAQKDARISMEKAAKAFARTAWPGRFERMDVGGQRIVVDGAHNPAGVRALRDALDVCFPDETRVFLLGILHDKAIDEMLDVLLRPEDVVVVTQPDSERAETSARLLGAVKKRAREATAEPDRERALALALSLAKGALLCCTGSLYLIGELRRRIAARQEAVRDAGIGNDEQH